MATAQAGLDGTQFKMLVLFVKTRNEADLLRLNLAHHLGHGFDHALIVDNDSTDATQDVLQEFRHLVTVTRTTDPNSWGSALMELLARFEEQRGSADWVAASDTDEFWWAADAPLESLLTALPAAVIAINSDQKLFLPTAIDPSAGPIYSRRTFRTSGTKSPLHTSYSGGKSLYRFAWLRNHPVTNSHWSTNVPHGPVRFRDALVHHYMIDGEESFVRKVKSFERVNPAIRLRHGSDSGSQQAPHAPLPRRGAVGEFKLTWWDVYQTGGEAGLREYYREKYLISTDAVERHLDRGNLVRDTAFATFKENHP